jgi:hypothetical protein
MDRDAYPLHNVHRAKLDGDISADILSAGPCGNVDCVPSHPMKTG